MMNPRHILLMLGVAVSLSACKPELDPPAFDSGRADFSRVVAMGGSIMAGSQDGALYREGQMHSLPELIVAQIREGVAVEFSSPLLPVGNVSLGTNPKPWESLLQTRSQLGNRTDCENVVSLGPVKQELTLADAQQAGLTDQVTGVTFNLALPGANFADLTRPDLAANATAGGPALFWSRNDVHDKSPLSRALELDPSFVIFWPGMQDIFQYASRGGALDPMPDPVAFRLKLDSTLALMTANGAKGVLATIPDVEYMPYFTTVSSQALELDAVLADSLNGIYNLGNIDIGFQAGANGFVVQDLTLPQPFRQMNPDEYICLTVPIDSMQCYLMGVFFQTMPDQYTLLETELVALRAAVAQMNAAIVALGAQYDFAVADVAGLYRDLSSGVIQDGVEVNTEFVTGNYFSLDGYAPTPKGTGLLANVFIEAINAHFDASVSTVRLDNLRAVLFP